MRVPAWGGKKKLPGVKIADGGVCCTTELSPAGGALGDTCGLKGGAVKTNGGDGGGCVAPASADVALDRQNGPKCTPAGVDSSSEVLRDHVASDGDSSMSPRSAATSFESFKMAADVGE
mmetsp:Transcript_56545/g.127094  ORF Transcript_56545/g.127094 Transcript_56545/m.127094 type:complete len:119 (+) Transcript_56545:341-697(+)